ncbi:DUF4870 domain-containing protein [bacterium]|nr:DUF4870 domain-containing protein [bacterium]
MDNGLRSDKEKQEKILAVAAHASVLLYFLHFFTLLVPLGIWIYEMQKPDGSRQTQYHAKQAFFFQLAYQLIILILSFIFGVLSLIRLGILVTPLLIIARLIFIQYAIRGAYKVWTGQPFRYAYITDILDIKEP